MPTNSAGWCDRPADRCRSSPARSARTARPGRTSGTARPWVPRPPPDRRAHDGGTRPERPTAGLLQSDRAVDSQRGQSVSWRWNTPVADPALHQPGRATTRQTQFVFPYTYTKKDFRRGWWRWLPKARPAVSPVMGCGRIGHCTAASACAAASSARVPYRWGTRLALRRLIWRAFSAQGRERCSAPETGWGATLQRWAASRPRCYSAVIPRLAPWAAKAGAYMQRTSAAPV